MNGIGGGGGMAYHSEDDYDDSMYGNGGAMVGNMVNPGGMVGTNLSKLSSVMPNYISSANISSLSGVSGGGPLSSLHGLTNQAQLIPSSHHSPVVMTPSYMNTSVSSNLSGLHGNTSIQSTPTHTGGRNQNNICCLIDDGRKCNRSAGNASYNKRVQKTVLHKRLRLETDPNIQHIYICDYHKMIIQNARTRQKKESDEDINDGNPDDVPEVDLYQLQVNTLRRYKKHYKISSRPGLNKAQLADILMRHFKTIPVQEKEIVTYFIYMVKAERNKLDNNRPDPLQPATSQGQMADYQAVRYT